jgi:four helix bundle protein
MESCTALADKREERSQEKMSADRRPAQSFRELLVWQKAHRFVLAIYQFTSELPRQEMYGLSVQMRRAAVSIPANIAEGFRKRGRPDKARFMNMAEGSLEESRYYQLLAQDLNYGGTDDLMVMLDEISRLLHAYTAALLTPDSCLLLLHSLRQLILQRFRQPEARQKAHRVN